eukprot:1160382-Pelagomonas_calceolata.AAC.12
MPEHQVLERRKEGNAAKHPGGGQMRPPERRRERLDVQYLSIQKRMWCCKAPRRLAVSPLCI